MVASAPETQPLVRDVLLRDGSTLRLQSPTPADFDDIKALYDGLSPDSRRLRFHGLGRRLRGQRSVADGAALAITVE